MKKRKIPLRTCIITREKLEKKDLVRIVKNKNGEIFADKTGKANGRGVYIKRNIETLKKAKETKALEKKLEAQISEEIYEEIEKIINE